MLIRLKAHKYNSILLRLLLFLHHSGLNKDIIEESTIGHPINRLSLIINSETISMNAEKSDSVIVTEI